MTRGTILPLNMYYTPTTDERISRLESDVKALRGLLFDSLQEIKRSTVGKGDIYEALERYDRATPARLSKFASDPRRR